MFKFYNTFLPLTCVFLLISCATVVKPMTPQETQCSALNKVLPTETQEFFAACVTDFNHRDAVFNQFVRKYTNYDICFEYKLSPSQEINREIKRRKISCDRIIKEQARLDRIRIENNIRSQVASTPADQLCIVWFNHQAEPFTLDLVEREVVRRKLNCPSIVRNQQQIQFQEQQNALQAQQMQVQQLQLQAQQEALQLQRNNAFQQQQIQRNNAFQQQLLINNANRMRTTNCQQFGNSVNCTSY